MNKYSNQILNIAFGGLVVGFMAIFTLATSLNGEDYAFQKKWSDENVLEHLLWTVNRSVSQINDWNARLGEQLSIFWLNAPETIYVLGATAAFVAASFLVGKLANLKLERFENIAFPSLLLFALWPSMDVFFWRTANAGYLQPSIFLLIAASFFLVPEKFMSLSQSNIKLAIVCFISFLAGLSFENSPIALGALMACNILFFGRRHVSFYKAWLPIASLFVGWSILMTAPSTTYRVGFYRDLFQFPGFTFDYIFLYRVPDVFKVFIGSSWFLFLLFLLASLGLLKAGQTRFVIANFAGIIITVATLIPSPYTEQRAFVFAWFLMVATLLRWLMHLRSSGKGLGSIKILTASVALVTCLAMIPMYREFGGALTSRDARISGLAQQECVDQMDFQEIRSDYPTRLLNNRDIWSVSTLEQVRRYYGC